MSENASENIPTLFPQTDAYVTPNESPHAEQIGTHLESHDMGNTSAKFQDLSAQAERRELEAVLERCEQIETKGGESGEVSLEESQELAALIEKGKALGNTIVQKDAETRKHQLSQMRGLLAGGQRVQAPTRQPARMITMPMGYRGLKVFNRGEEDLRLAYTVGQYVAATLFKNPASQVWCREHGIGMYGQHVEAINTAGGVWVPQEWSSRIIELRDMYAQFRPNADREPMASDAKAIRRRKAGYTAQHTGERKETKESDPNIWNYLELVARKVDILTSQSDELNMDALPQMADSMTMAAAEGFGLREDLDGFFGEGKSDSGGILGFMYELMQGSKKGAVPAAAGHNSAETIDLADITKLMGTVPAHIKRRPGKKWYMSSYFASVMATRIQLTQGGAGSQDVAEGQRQMFMGYPIEETDLFPSEGTHTDQPMFAFGNLMLASVMGDRAGITMKQDTEIKTDELLVKWIERYDIQNHYLGDDQKAGAMVVMVGTGP